MRKSAYEITVENRVNYKHLSPVWFVLKFFNEYIIKIHVIIIFVLIKSSIFSFSLLNLGQKVFNNFLFELPVPTSINLSEIIFNQRIHFNSVFFFANDSESFRIYFETLSNLFNHRMLE